MLSPDPTPYKDEPGAGVLPGFSLLACTGPEAASFLQAQTRAASSPRLGQPITRPGMSRSAEIELSLWKWPPKPFW